MKELLNRMVKGDAYIWLVIVVLAVASLLSVYSATGFLAYQRQGGNTSHYMFWQMLSLGLGVAIMIVVSNISSRYIARFSVLFLYLSVLLLAITLFSGVNLNTATRWLTIPGIGITFQPSEIAKLAIIVYVARVLAQNQQEGVAADAAFKPIVFHVAIVALLIFSENLSTAFLVVMVSAVMMFIGRVSLKLLFGSGVVVAIFLGLTLTLASHVDFLPRAQTWANRVEVFLSSEEQSTAASYQSDQSKIAIATGGILGKGPGNSVQRNFIPHPYSDFIYAIIAEEYGFGGAFLILFCYLILLGRVSVIVRKSDRTFPAFLAYGLGLMLVSQAFLNMGVAIGVFPVTGQPLPLVSLGTTSVLFTCVAFGMILGAGRATLKEEVSEDVESSGNEEYYESEEK
ncbi:FtsW/RodA/SpoVE family cell cycle protein [Marinilabiliaceae bacterium ANBcel2]|nr:FtsW/RodA/SpoVE family cell cycle protein [Marinilabiliaceae bacterium ANBcel2]